MGMTYEAQRYNTVKNFRTDDVEEQSFHYKKNPLYKWQPAIDEGFRYSEASRPKESFASVEEALAAIRKRLDGS